MIQLDSSKTKQKKQSDEKITPILIKILDLHYFYKKEKEKTTPIKE